MESEAHTEAQDTHEGMQSRRRGTVVSVTMPEDHDSDDGVQEVPIPGQPRATLTPVSASTASVTSTHADHSVAPGFMANMDRRMSVDTSAGGVTRPFARRAADAVEPYWVATAKSGESVRSVEESPANRKTTARRRGKSTPGLEGGTGETPGSGRKSRHKAKPRSKSRGRRRHSTSATAKLAWGSGHSTPIYLRKFTEGATPSATTPVKSRPKRHSTPTPTRQHVGRPAGGYAFPSAPVLVPARSNAMPKLSSAAGSKLTGGTTRRKRRKGSKSAKKAATVVSEHPLDPADGEEQAAPSDDGSDLNSEAEGPRPTVHVVTTGPPAPRFTPSRDVPITARSGATSSEDSCNSRSVDGQGTSQCSEACNMCGAPPVNAVADALRGGSGDDVSVFTASSAGASGWAAVMESAEDLATRVAAAKGFAAIKVERDAAVAEASQLTLCVRGLEAAVAALEVKAGATKELEGEINRLQADLTDARAETAFAEGLIAELKLAASHRVDELARQHQAAMDLDRVRLQLQDRLAAATAQREAAETSAAASEMDLRTLTAAVEERDATVAKLTTANVELRAAVEASGETIREQMATIATLQAKRPPLAVDTDPHSVKASGGSSSTPTPVSTASARARRAKAEEERQELMDLIQQSKSRSSVHEGDMEHLCSRLEELEGEMSVHKRHVKGSHARPSAATLAQQEADAARDNLRVLQEQSAQRIAALQEQVATLQDELEVAKEAQGKPGPSPGPRGVGTTPSGSAVPPSPPTITNTAAPTVDTVQQLNQELQVSWAEADAAKAKLEDTEQEMQRMARDLQRMFSFAAGLQAQLEAHQSGVQPGTKAPIPPSAVQAALAHTAADSEDDDDDEDDDELSSEEESEGEEVEPSPSAGRRFSAAGALVDMSRLKAELAKAQLEPALRPTAIVERK